MNKNPYVGSRPYQQAEAGSFFGRTKLVSQVVEKLLAHRFVSVVGPSGVGKTSLVRAGVNSRLLEDCSGTDDKWLFVEMRPGPRPLAALAGELRQELRRTPDGAANAESLLDGVLKAGNKDCPEALHAALRSMRRNLLLIVDQFEDIFRSNFAAAGAGEDEFIEFMLSLRARGQERIYLAVLLRADFLGDCAQFPEFVEKMNESISIVPVFSRAEIREIITEPARPHGAKFERTLLDRILRDFDKADTDRLPLLQHVLRRMWDLKTKTGKTGGGRVFRLRDYLRVGALSDAPPISAEGIYAALDDEQKRIAEVAFKGITERDEEGRLLRRSARLDESAAVAGVPSEQVALVLEKFESHGFVCHGANKVVDLTRQGLMRKWPRLRQWIDEEANSAQMYRRLEDFALRYERDGGELLAGPELNFLSAWAEKEKPSEAWALRYGRELSSAMKYLNHCVRESQKAAAKRRAIFICYRRRDSLPFVSDLYKRLAERLGEERVFRDVNTIEAGEVFTDKIEAALESCAMLLVVVGNQWLKIEDDTGRRRLLDLADYVRREITTAFNREVPFIIPVLVGVPQMPLAADLPEDLCPLRDRQAKVVGYDNFDVEFENLVRYIEEKLAPPPDEAADEPA